MFCGGGLMAVGLQAAGFDLIFANDFEKRAVQAYNHNIGPHAVCGDITSAEIQAQIPDADVIAGGPPCQDYSIAGSGAGEDGDRGKLVWTYLNIIEQKQPKAFVFENVKGLLTKKHRPTFDALLVNFKEIGYTVSWKLVNSWDHGVAQKRERVFIVGIRSDLGITFKFPDPYPEDYRTRVLRDVISDLPNPSNFFYTHRTKGRKAVFGTDEPSPTLKTFQRNPPPGYFPHESDAHIQQEMKNHVGGVQMKEYKGHTASNLSDPAKAIVAGAHGVPGGANCFVPENHEGAVPTKEYGQREFGVGRHPVPRMDEPSYTIVASATGGKNAVLPDNHDEHSFWFPKSEYSYGQANRVQSMDGPSNTIPAHHNSGQPIHPSQAPRRFTVRECLRIQSVPDWYVIPDMALGAQYKIVGNGVASRVAYLIGIALAEQLLGGPHD